MDSNIVLFSGYARLPRGISSSYIHETMGLVVLVDIRTSIIVDAECTLSTRTSERFISKILIGHSIAEGLDELGHKIDRHYEGNSKKAIITALRSVFSIYRSYIKANEESV